MISIETLIDAAEQVETVVPDGEITEVVADKGYHSNQVMVDLGDTTEVETGEEVVLMGKQGEEEISIYEWCQKLDTIPYEVTCGISGRVQRVFT